jgi:hypothetical protein
MIRHDVDICGRVISLFQRKTTRKRKDTVKFGVASTSLGQCTCEGVLFGDVFIVSCGRKKET